MKIQQTLFQSIDLLHAEKYAAPKSMTAVQQHTVNYAAELTISEEGRQALKEKVRELSPEIEEEDVVFGTAKDTNFVEFEQYMTLRELYVPMLAGREHDAKDFMAALAEAYETRYNEIWEQHKNGDRQVTYDIVGESFVTLEEDLEGLNKAYERSLADLQGFITIQQTNKAFATQNYSYFDEEYKKTAVSIMKEALEQFQSLFWGPDYQQGAMKDILSRIMNGNEDFLEKTQKLFS